MYMSVANLLTTPSSAVSRISPDSSAVSACAHHTLPLLKLQICEVEDTCPALKQAWQHGRRVCNRDSAHLLNKGNSSAGAPNVRFPGFVGLKVNEVLRARFNLYGEPCAPIPAYVP